MMLAHALSQHSDLLVVSFTRQYPRWLFPGESDREEGVSAGLGSRCQFVLDSLDPRTWRRTANIVVEHLPDAVIIPWWTIFWAPCFRYLARSISSQGIPVHFFCHNVVDHEASGWKKALTGWVLRSGNGFFVQSSAEERRLRALVARGPVTVHGHPVFGQFPSAPGPRERRAALELLFFGFVRPYKGLDVLLHALARLEDADFMLTVAGEFWGGLDDVRRQISELDLGNRVQVIPRYVSEIEAAELFARADAVVMPYLSATGSGVLGLAYRYGKPVIASRISGIEEHIVDGKTGILVRPGSVDELASALRSIDATRARAMASAIEAVASGLTWESLAAVVLRQVAAGSTERRP
jgi:glycosyltransferase involved in cell wall biosynthesis